MSISKIVGYLVMVVGMLLSAKVVFASVALGFSIFQLSRELDATETIRISAYHIIIAYSVLAAIVAVLSFRLSIVATKDGGSPSYLLTTGLLALVVYGSHLIYALLPLTHKAANAVLNEFSVGLTGCQSPDYVPWQCRQYCCGIVPEGVQAISPDQASGEALQLHEGL